MNSLFFIIFILIRLIPVLSFLYTAMQQVLDNLGDLPNSMGAGDLDLIFLRGLMESPIVRSLAKVQLNG